MRSILTIISFFFCCILRGQSPIAYYTFDNTPRDFSGNHNDGTPHGDIHPSMDRFGNPCGAYRFDGKSAYIEVPSSSTLESPVSSFTITTWYRIDNIYDNTWLTVLCKGNGAAELADNPQYRLQTQQNTAAVMNSCTPGIADGSSTISLNTAFTKCDPDFKNHLFASGKWSFYALVYNGSTVTAYMDNRKVFEYNYNVPLTPNTSPLYIGMDEPGNNEYFEGHLDDLKIYNRALTEKEILDLYNDSGKPGGLGEEFEMPFLQNINAPMAKNSCGAVVSFSAPVIRQPACATVSVRQVHGQPPGSLFPAGKHLITYEAVSSSGDEQRTSFYIIVKDNIAPALFLPKDTILYVKKGEKGTTVDYRNPVASDNCAVRSVTLINGPASKSFFPTGKHTVIYRAVDINGNSTDQSFQVEVREKNDPPPVTPPLPPPVMKKDTVVVRPVEPPIDTIITPPVAVPPTPNPLTIPARDTTIITVPPDLNSREKIELKVIEVNSLVLEATLFDNGVFDGDTVSLFLNKQVLLSKQEVNTRGTKFKIPIDSAADNELLMYAENLGTIPPNTGLLIIYDGATRHEINLLSTLKTNGVITIRRKKRL